MGAILNWVENCWEQLIGIFLPPTTTNTMKHLFLLIALLLSPLALSVANETAGHATPSVSEAREALRAASVNQEADFDTAYAQAKAAGVEEAVLLEGKVLRNLGGGDLQTVLDLIPSMEEHAADFVVGADGFFANRTQVYGLIENLKALRANEAGDWDAFETHVKEGFWKSPELSNMFGMARLITERHESLAQKELMSSVRLPMDMEILSVDGTKTTLAKVAHGQKAVLLDFWASWCGPCIMLMPELKKKADALPAQGVFVAGMNTDSSDQLKHAREVQEKHGMDMPWLLEPESSPFSRALAINSIPRMILLNPEGKVLFNGHPMDPELKSALASIGVKL
jgi:thiol-disulfide isomerase/thioredoxin